MFLQCRSAAAGRGRRPRADRRRRLHRPRPRPRRRPSDRPRRRRPRPCPARTSTATSARAPRAHHSALAPRSARPPLRRTSPAQCPRTIKFNKPLRIEEFKSYIRYKYSSKWYGLRNKRHSRIMVRDVWTVKEASLCCCLPIDILGRIRAFDWLMVEFTW